MRGSGAHLYLRLLHNVAPYWRTFVLGVGAMVVLAATEPAIPALLKPMLDGSFVDKDLGIAASTALLLVGLFALRGVAAFTSSAALAWVGGKLVMDLRTLVFDKLYALPADHYDRTGSGTLISKVTYDVSQVTEAGTHVLTVLVRDTLAVLGLIGWMLYLDWKLTLVALATAPVVVFVVRGLSGRLRRMSRNLQQTMGHLTQLLQESIDGQKVVRIFGGHERERRRFREHANWARRFQFKFAAAAAANSPISQFVVAVALALIIYLAAHQAASGALTVGGFVSFLTAMAMLFSPIKRLTGVNGPLQKGLAAAESVFGLLDQPPEPDYGTRILHNARGELAFENVSFAYAGAERPALEDVSLSIAPGETVALVGPSGGGKTTLINLIPRFYQPTRGRILLDGVDIAELTLASLRRNAALVSQEVVLFDDTVAANVAYGAAAESGEAQVAEALEAAQALDFVRELPQGLYTRIGQNGARLSAGQRQRLAIARAFLKDAPVLILDEATSALDSVSERKVQVGLERLRRGRTTLVIAHRLSTVEGADRIIVMAQGRVVESGTHASLLERNSLYTGLYRFQFARQGEDAAAGAR